MSNPKSKQAEIEFFLLQAKKNFDKGDSLKITNPQMAVLSYSQAITSARMALNLAKTGVPHDADLSTIKNNPVNPFKHDVIRARQTTLDYILNIIREIQDLGFAVEF